MSRDKAETIAYAIRKECQRSSPFTIVYYI